MKEVNIVTSIFINEISFINRIKVRKLHINQPIVRYFLIEIGVIINLMMMKVHNVQHFTQK